MHMLYNSDNFAVVRIDLPDPTAASGSEAAGAASGRGCYEIVDKFARKEIFLAGPLADKFREGVQALMDSGPTEEALDEYISRFTPLMQQPVVLH